MVEFTVIPVMDRPTYRAMKKQVSYYGNITKLMGDFIEKKVLRKSLEMLKEICSLRLTYSIM